MEAEGRREDSGHLYKQKETQQVELIDRILSDRNIEAAIHAVKSNRGAAGIDKMTVDRGRRKEEITRAFWRMEPSRAGDKQTAYGL